MEHTFKKMHEPVVSEEKKPWKKGRRVDEKLLIERFCQLYAKHGNLPARECAVRAGYSPKSAANAACRLLKRDAVQARVKELTEGFTDTEEWVPRLRVLKRRELFNTYFDILYRWKYEELRAGLGHHQRYCLDERRQLTTRWKDRKEGHLTHYVHKMQAMEFAREKATQRFGDFFKRKKRYNRFLQRWEYRDPK